MNTTSDNRLFVGIDFGTFKTTITTSRGEKSCFRSVVGFPKDIIAKTLLGKEFHAGEEALKYSGPLSLRSPYQNGEISYDRRQGIAVADELLTYAMTEVKPRPEDQVFGIICIPALANEQARKRLLETAGDLLHRSAIVSGSLCAACGLDKLTNAILIDIGGSAINVCGLQGAIPGPDDHITIPRAGYHIDSILMESLKQRYPGLQITANIVRKIKEQHAFVGEPEKQVTVELRNKGVPRSYDITDEIRYSCETIVSDLAEAVKLSLSRFDIERQDEALQNIYLFGGGSMIKGINKCIAGQLDDYGDVVVTTIDAPFFVGSTGALKLAASVDSDLWHKIGVVA